jgi:phospholipid N-methyltransferase
MNQSGFRNSWYFLRRFLDSPRGVGSLVPSSGPLAEAMVADLGVPPDRSVIELGPGTGAITRHLLGRLDDPGQYLGIESDPAFVELLRKRFPRAPFQCESAERMERLLRDGAVTPPRYIVSGIPFAALPRQRQYRIISALRRVLPEDAEFRMFQYVHAWRLPAAVRFRRRMDQCFRTGNRPRLVLANVPPAMVLSWQPEAREPRLRTKPHEAVPVAADPPPTAVSREHGHVH